MEKKKTRIYYNDPPYFLISYIIIIFLLSMLILIGFILYINCIGLNIKVTLELPDLINYNQVLNKV